MQVRDGWSPTRQALGGLPLSGVSDIAASVSPYTDGSAFKTGGSEVGPAGSGWSFITFLVLQNTLPRLSRPAEALAGAAGGRAPSRYFHR